MFRQSEALSKVDVKCRLHWLPVRQRTLFKVLVLTYCAVNATAPNYLLQLLHYRNVTRTLRPCPHDTFPNWARSIATSSRPVARVHTGAIGTLVPDPRDHLSTWNEWARAIAIGRAQSSLSGGCSSGRYRPVINSASVSARLLDLLLPLKPHMRFHTSSIDQSNMKLWSKADTRPLISIWGDANSQDGLDNCRRNGEVYK